MNDQLQQTAQALKQEWGLQLGSSISEEELLSLLADRLVQIIEKGPDAFFRLMYRLDISEKKLTAIMHDKDAAKKIARLVYDRQLQKIRSREAHRKTGETPDPDLTW